MTIQQRANSMVDFFVLCYKQKYKRSPNINRYRCKYQLMDILKDFDDHYVQELLEYYFSLDGTEHSPSDFINNYTDIIDLRKQMEEDAEQRRRAREKTKQRVQEYRNSEQ